MLELIEVGIISSLGLFLILYLIKCCQNYKIRITKIKENNTPSDYQMD